MRPMLTEVGSNIGTNAVTRNTVYVDKGQGTRCSKTVTQNSTYVDLVQDVFTETRGTNAVKHKICQA